MTSIDCLPPEILVRIFFCLNKCELFDVEKVCRQWKWIIDEHVWGPLKCISAASIGYPDDDFVSNWIEMVRRVGSVKDIFTGISPKMTRLNKSPRMKEALKHAMMDVLKKLASDAVFPLDFLQDVVAMEYPQKDRWSKTVPKLYEARKEVAKLMNKLELGVFQELKVNKVYVHGAKYSHARNPFAVSYRGKELSVPLDLHRITRMNVGCVRVCISLEYSGSTSATRSLIKKLLHLSKLELIEVDRFEFIYPAMLEDERASAVVLLNFHPHQCHFTLEEFTSLLTALSKKNTNIRNEKTRALLSEWKKNKCIQSSEITIHSSELHNLECLLDKGDTDEEAFYANYDALNIILSRVFPSLTTKLHLEVYHVQEDEADFLTLLREQGMFSQLKEFTLSLTDEKREEREDPYEEMYFWELNEAVERSKKMLHCLADNLCNLERLKFDFTLSGKLCPTTMFDQIQVVGPLPRLLELTYLDLPCFPFIISVVKQAPNLRRLYITSQHFDEERIGIQWIKQLLDSLDNNRELRTLTIRVFRDEGLYRGRYSPDKGREEAALRQEEEADRELLAGIELRVGHLLSVLPRLHRLLVAIETCGFYAEANRDGLLSHDGRANKDEYDFRVRR